MKKFLKKFFMIFLLCLVSVLMFVAATAGLGFILNLLFAIPLVLSILISFIFWGFAILSILIVCIKFDSM